MATRAGKICSQVANPLHAAVTDYLDRGNGWALVVLADIGLGKAEVREPDDILHVFPVSTIARIVTVINAVTTNIVSDLPSICIKYIQTPAVE